MEKVDERQQNVARTVFIFLTFCVLSIGIAGLSPPIRGIYRGGDTSWPWSTTDAVAQLKSILNPWASHIVSSGFYTSDNSGWFVNLLRVFAFLVCGGNAALAQRGYVLFFMALPMTTMYFLLKKFFAHEISCVIGAVLFGASYVTFNFTQMGWDNLQLTYAFLPIAALIGCSQSTERSKQVLKLFLVGYMSSLLVSGTSIAYPSIVLFTFASFSLRNSGLTWPDVFRKTLTRTSCYTAGLLLGHSFWIIPRLIWNPYLDETSLNALAKSGVSIGSRHGLWFSSWLNGSGTQYNNSYFAFFNRGTLALSFVVALFAIVGLTQPKTRSLFFVKASVSLIGMVLILTSLIDSTRLSFVARVLGRDEGRLSALVLIALIIMAGSVLDSDIFSRGIAVSIGIITCIVSCWPFVYGLEAQEIPAQPALTLRPVALAEDFSDLESRLSTLVSPMDQTITVLPGAPLVKLENQGSRFEPPYNLVAGSSFHLPLPASWSISDKTNPKLSRYYELRGEILTSGDPGRIFNLMLDEGSQVLVFALGELSDGDKRSLLAVSSSDLFRELKMTNRPVARSFRVFVRKQAPDFGVLGPSRQMFLESGPTSSHLTTRTFLGARRSPFGYVQTVCFENPMKLSEPLRTNVTYSKYWRVKVFAVDRDACLGGNTQTKDQIRVLQTKSDRFGFLQLSLGSTEVVPAVQIDIVNEPARLQEFFLKAVGIVSLLILLGFVIFRLKNAR